MQRLFSTFPCGFPGAGLLFLRAAVAAPLVYAGLTTALSSVPILQDGFIGLAAVLLLVGLWTPVAGAVIAVTQLTLALAHPESPWALLESAVFCAALAMLGPGCWSIDARLFGRKHLEIPPR